MTTPKEITEIIRKGLNDRLEEILTNSPELADGKTEEGLSFLLYAVYCGNKTATGLVRQRKKFLDIYEASGIGDLGTVRKHVNKKHDLIDSFSPDGFTPLSLSCFFGHPDVAKYLIEQGADVNKPSNNQFKVAPIHSACANSSYEMVELLLRRGADPNARQQADATPLHEAAHTGQTKSARLLIEHGADVNAKLTTGETPLSMAEEKSFAETAELIRKHGGK